MRRMNSFLVVAAALSFAGCKSSPTGGSGTASAADACVNGKVDLSKISGDWMATAPLDDFDGKVPGNQYRLRFTQPAADGTVKAMMAWRMDSRPFTGKLEKNALGYKISLLEDMSEDVIKQLKAQNNQDPSLRMRASLLVTAAETGCQLEVLDNYQSFVGEKVIENTAMGTVKLAAYTGSAPLSFTRCTASRTVWMDGKADDASGRPLVNVTADKPFKARSVVEMTQMPKECTSSVAEVFVDGERVKEKVPGTPVKEDGVDSVAFETELSVKQGVAHPVELHIYGTECGEAKEKRFVASLCNFAATR